MAAAGRPVGREPAATTKTAACSHPRIQTALRTARSRSTDRHRRNRNRCIPVGGRDLFPMQSHGGRPARSAMSSSTGIQSSASSRRRVWCSSAERMPASTSTLTTTDETRRSPSSTAVANARRAASLPRRWSIRTDVSSRSVMRRSPSSVRHAAAELVDEGRTVLTVLAGLPCSEAVLERGELAVPVHAAVRTVERPAHQLGEPHPATAGCAPEQGVLLVGQGDLGAMTHDVRLHHHLRWRGLRLPRHSAPSRRACTWPHSARSAAASRTDARTEPVSALAASSGVASRKAATTRGFGITSR
jgi:hypothetical protein